jgi:hypothetical protein
MPTPPSPDHLLQEAVDAFRTYGTKKQAADALGLPWTTLDNRLKAAAARGIEAGFNRGAVDSLETVEFDVPRKGRVSRYLLTTAQCHTAVHAEFWANLQALALHYDATLMVSPVTYNKEAFGNDKMQKCVKRDAEIKDGQGRTSGVGVLTDREHGQDDASNYAPEVREYLYFDRVNIAPRLTFCSELNILPTARKPLQGLESYTGRNSTVVPHPALALKSVPGMKGEGVKLMYTTGACTLRNYIQRKEGFRAEHFHAYAALLVEVDSDGRWWCRHVEQGSDGTACDLDLVFKDGKLAQRGARVADICWGDIHASKLDDSVAAAGWRGKRNMLDTLRPYSQHIHDLLDATPFGHHTRKDPFEDFRAYVKSHRRSMAEELRTTARVAAELARPWCDSVVVNSNHDRHLGRALAEIDWRKDSENAELILRLTADMLRAIREDDSGFNLVEAAIRMFSGCGLPGIRFLKEDESDVILRHINGGIECGLHGDRGANGAKGTAAGIAKASRRINMADKHAAEIVDMVYVAGVSGKLDMGYNKGMSSWSNAHTLTYPNGCRVIVTVYEGRWHAASR